MVSEEQVRQAIDTVDGISVSEIKDIVIVEGFVSVTLVIDDDFRRDAARSEVLQALNALDGVGKAEVRLMHSKG